MGAILWSWSISRSELLQRRLLKGGLQKKQFFGRSTVGIIRQKL